MYLWCYFLHHVSLLSFAIKILSATYCIYYLFILFLVCLWPECDFHESRYLHHCVNCCISSSCNSYWHRKCSIQTYWIKECTKECRQEEYGIWLNIQLLWASIFNFNHVRCPHRLPSMCNLSCSPCPLLPCLEQYLFNSSSHKIFGWVNKPACFLNMAICFLFVFISFYFLLSL